MVKSNPSKAKRAIKAMYGATVGTLVKIRQPWSGYCEHAGKVGIVKQIGDLELLIEGECGEFYAWILVDRCKPVGLNDPIF